jgi:hypothetical protein
MAKAPAPITSMSAPMPQSTCPTFAIGHDAHGQAVCDARQWPEFAELGWTKVVAKAAAAPAA